eukprot:5983079-Alexandrium_andersonii.AAC.1
MASLRRTMSMTRRSALRAPSPAGSASAWTLRSVSTPLRRVCLWTSWPELASPPAWSLPSGR